MGQPLTKGTNLSRPRRVKVFAEAPIRDNNAYWHSDVAVRDSANKYKNDIEQAYLYYDVFDNTISNLENMNPITSSPSRSDVNNMNLLSKRKEEQKKLQNEIQNLEIDFENFKNRHQLERRPIRDSTFIKEAQDLADFYKRTSPETEVDIIPFYGKEDSARISNEFASLGEEDLPVLMGHAGSTIGGTPNEYLAEMYKGCSARDLLIGSCSFNKYSGPFRETGKNVTMRPNTPWRGVNPYGKTLMDAMYGTVSEDSIAPTPTYKKDYLRFRGNQILGE